MESSDRNTYEKVYAIGFNAGKKSYRDRLKKYASEFFEAKDGR